MSDYRVRIYIASCLKERLSPIAIQNTGDEVGFQLAAFQLALCFRLGFGLVPNDEQVQGMLNRSGRPIQYLDMEIVSISRGKFRKWNEYYRELFEKGFGEGIDAGEHYHESNLLDEAEVWLQKDVTNLGQILQDSAPIVRTVKTSLSSVFEFQGRWTETERLRLQVMKTNLRVLDVEHPSTLTSMANLAKTYSN